jgi:hypothetical protein
LPPVPGNCVHRLSSLVVISVNRAEHLLVIHLIVAAHDH